MKITVKLFATFRDGRDKIQVFELEQGETPEDVISILGIEKAEVAILLVNGRDGQFDKPLLEGDLIALFPPVGGG
ncbi:MoaD/ThiS family protein [Clostridium estertheticum]|uniref:MoaD/ThiS family protein n=1 Tax=Clostridium estertheticum TaxID=238834 RepID=UPI0013E909A4|nr:MoaD/ThiS family protein [Clostridium estertheticum]MBZ9686483.1 MoaD/ThiS family protein [Clostridium estertheticum]